MGTLRSCGTLCDIQIISESKLTIKVLVIVMNREGKIINS